MTSHLQPHEPAQHLRGRGRSEEPSEGPEDKAVAVADKNCLDTPLGMLNYDASMPSIDKMCI